MNRPGNVWKLGVAVTVVVLVFAAPASSTTADEPGTGALIELRSGAATFVPTSDDGLEGVLVMPAPKATFDPDPSERGTTRLPALRAAASLRDQPTVEAVLRRSDAPASEDTYGLTLSGISYTMGAGSTATAAVRPIEPGSRPAAASATSEPWAAPDRGTTRSLSEGGAAARTPAYHLGSVDLLPISGDVRK